MDKARGDTREGSMMHELPLRERAHGRWQAILPAFGLDRRYLTRRHMPCPWCGGVDRFRFVDREGSGNWICNQCGKGDGIMLVERLLGVPFQEAAQRVEAVLGTVKATARSDTCNAVRRRQAMQALWRRAVAITRRDPAWRYLAGRGIELEDGELSDALRYCAECEYGWRDRMPALLARVVAPDGRRAVNVQRLFLTPQGEKADMPKPRRMMAGTTPVGSAVRLGKPAARLGVAEGIETALSCRALYGITTWATLGTANMEAFVAPGGTEELLVFSENDENYSGQAAAYRLANRAVCRQKIKATVMVPPSIGDWNDVLINRKGGRNGRIERQSLVCRQHDTDAELGCADPAPGTRRVRCGGAG
jgi:putative DNA primase/helicase